LPSEGLNEISVLSRGFWEEQHFFWNELNRQKGNGREKMPKWAWFIKDTRHRCHITPDHIVVKYYFPSDVATQSNK